MSTFNWEFDIDSEALGLIKTVDLHSVRVDLIQGKSVDPAVVVALLEAMEDKIGELEKLESENEDLKDQISELKNEIDNLNNE